MTDGGVLISPTCSLVICARKTVEVGLGAANVE